MLTVLLSAACADKSEPLGPTAAVPHATTTTNPYAIPAVIDEAYVNRVLAGLDQAYGDLTRLIVETRTLLPEAVERINALYVGQFAQLQIDLFQAELRDGLRIYKPEAGNQVSTVTSLISVAPKCFFAEIHRDLSLVLASTEPQVERLWVALVPAEDVTGKRELNPTPWQYIFDGFKQGFTEPKDACIAVS